MGRLTDCFLAFGVDPLENIGKLIALAGELLGATCAFYNRLDGELLYSIEQWNTPPDFRLDDPAAGRLCQDLILKEKEDWFYVPDLQTSPYADEDPNILRCGLQTYLGHIVKLGGKRVGTLCVLFTEDYLSSEDDRNFLGVLASAIAIEETRRATVDEVRQGEARFKDIVDALPHVTVQGYDKDGIVTYWNAASEKLFGYTCEEAIGRRIVDLIIPPDMRDMVAQIIRNGAETGEMPEAAEVTLMKKDGGGVPVLSGRVVLHPNSDQTEIFCVDVDLGNLKKVEDELRQVEERYRLLVEQLPAITYIVELTDPPKTIFISPQVEQILGFTQEEWLADPELWAKRLHPDDHGYVIEEILRKNQSGNPFFLEYRVLTREGETVWFRNHALFSRNPSGEPQYTLGIMLDITEEKDTREELEQSRRRMQSSEKMHALGMLAGGVAHDFNNLIMIILNTAYLAMEAEGLPEEVQPLLEDIVSASKRSSELTHQLLAYSRQQPLSPRVLDINELVAGMDGMLRRLIGEDIDLSIDVANERYPVRADRGQIEQVIVNLAVNARDAMPRGGVLRIRTEPATLTEEDIRNHSDEWDGSQSNFICISLADSGVGMTPGVLAHIFEPFYTTKGVGRGTGLGLSSSYGTVKQHDGFILVESSPGEGTTFRIYLPQVEAAPNTSEYVAGDHIARGSETVLVAEDEPTVRRVVCLQLEQLGYNVIDGGYGNEALKIAQAHEGPIELLVTDIIMPELDGVTLAEKLREDRPDLKVVFASGYPMDRLGQHGIEEGSELVLKKPFVKADVARAVRAVLDS